MATKIIFTCPVCGSHELMQIQQAVHRVHISLARGEGGMWQTNTVGEVQELTGRILGYRCAQCRYPDVPNHEDNDGFYWQTLQQIDEAKVLHAPLSPVTPEPITCIICQPDGCAQHIRLIPPHGGTLSLSERQEILTAHNAPSGSVLLVEDELNF